MTSGIVHYQELALKGRNRPWFVRTLVRNLKEALTGCDVRTVEILMGRIGVVFGPATDRAVVRARIARIPGVANFAFAERCEPDLDVISRGILAEVKDQSPASFRVRVRRADKQFGSTSPAIEREIGGRIKQATGWKVDLDSPALVVLVEILPGAAYFSWDRIPGIGGLPCGVSGKVACLMSGGIDSPVAAYRMLKRGCRVRLIHFHSYPIVSPASIEKARRLAALLTESQLRTRLILVPFGEVQKRIITTTPQGLRVVLYRRFMMRIASRLARRHGAKALVTGEVVGQVASQTLDNLVTIDAAAELPVLRPLIGFDKEQITAEAKALGSYPISILPDEDCCQLFTPKHPATAAKLAEAERAEHDLPVAELLEAAVRSAVIEDLRFPVQPVAETNGVS